ncbi:MAG: amino acid permease [Thiotrichales bacterium]|nr:MAG: amino acid permease [Thiotrichales bacterium]
MKNKKPKKILSTFNLVMITILSVDSLRNLPSTAIFGSSVIFFFIVAAIVFLIPSALVSTELAVAYPQSGGVYVWVKEAFGPKFGFFAIWLQWIESVIWFPTILSFMAGIIGYLINPELASSKTFLISVVLVSFWGATLVNLIGMHFSALLSTICAIFGLLLPMLLIIGLGVLWVFLKRPMQIDFSLHSVLPNFSEPGVWVALTGVMLSFCGMEVSAAHAGEVIDPKRAFPRALTISIFIILFTLIMGALSIAMVVPRSHISLVAGMIQAFDMFFRAYHMHWVLPIVAVTLVIGSLGGLSNWIIAPIKGLMASASDDCLPTHCLKENKYGAPWVLLFYQALIVTLLTLVFLLMPSVNGSYWVLTVLTAQLYMLMYVFMFAAGIYLKYKNKVTASKDFRIPFGKIGMYTVATIGLIGVIFTFVIGLIPPDNIEVGSTLHYEVILITGLILMISPPFVLQAMRNKKLKAKA